MFPIGTCINVFRSRIVCAGSAFAQGVKSLTFPAQCVTTRNLSMENAIRTWSNFSSHTPAVSSSLPALVPGYLPSFLQSATPVVNSIRSHIRIHFPRPRETKRIKVHGWKTRMSTPSQRRIIMRRILKGRYSLSH